MSRLQTYVSFAGEDGFLGVVVVDEPDPVAALSKINQLGLNPGGQAALFRVPPGEYPIDRLLSREELRALGCKGRAEMGDEAVDAALASHALIICEDCAS